MTLQRIAESVVRACLILALATAACGCKSGDATPRVSSNDLVVAEALGPAPGFTLVDLDGRTVSLSDYKGNAVVLDFWATWCAPCVREIPHFVDIYEAHREDGLVIIGIPISDAPEDVRAFVAEKSVDYPILMGDESVVRSIAQSYGGVLVIPTTFFLDADHQIVTRLQGYQTKEQLDPFVKAILPPAPDPES